MSSSKIIKLARANPRSVLIGLATQHSTPQHSTTDHSATHHSATQHSATQHSNWAPDSTAATMSPQATPTDVGQIFPSLAEKRTTGVTAQDVREMMAKAKAESEMILSNAAAEAENVRQQAYEEGFQSGYADGTMAAKGEALEHVRRISELARNAAVDMPCVLRNLEEAVIGLSLSIAEKIVYQRLAEDRDLVVSMVKGALDSANIKDVMRVRVNPEEIETLRPYWKEQRWDDGGIELVADPSVQLGGCIIDTKSSVMDAQIDTKLAELDKALRAELDADAR